MKITQEADYALRITALLATADGPVGAPRIAESVCAPTRFAMKILHGLAARGIVTAVRGVSGGYKTAVPPDKLSLRQVVEAVDGPIILQKCLCDEYVCTRNADKERCRYHRLFAELSDMVAEALGNVTVADMVNGGLPLDELLKKLHI